jgi:hypothetical protein
MRKLDDDVTIEPLVAGQVDGPHPAGTERLAQSIAIVDDRTLPEIGGARRRTPVGRLWRAGRSTRAGRFGFAYPGGSHTEQLGPTTGAVVPVVGILHTTAYTEHASSPPARTPAV